MNFRAKNHQFGSKMRHFSTLCQTQFSYQCTMRRSRLDANLAERLVVEGISGFRSRGERSSVETAAAALMSPHKTWGGRPHNYRLRCPTLGYPKWFANIDQLHLHFQQQISNFQFQSLPDWNIHTEKLKRNLGHSIITVELKVVVIKMLS